MAGAALAGRLAALLALSIPALAGIAYMASFGAPDPYLLVNAAALAIAMVWILVAPVPHELRLRRALALALVAILFIPLFTGPHIGNVARWVPLGPVTLHAGMLVVPALAMLAARDPDYAAPLLLTALLAAFLQPDAGTGLALTFAAVGLHDVTRDWKIGVTAIISFFASLVMAMRGELPPQPFVERVFADLLGNASLVAGALLAALAAGFFLILHGLSATREVRYALGGSLFGFGIAALVSHYPTPLVGYGAAPILGYGLALGWSRPSRAADGH